MARRNFAEILAPGNSSRWAIVWRCLCGLTFSHVDTIPACDRQAERQTDGWTHDDCSIYRASIALRNKDDTGNGRSEFKKMTDEYYFLIADTAYLFGGQTG